jgi:hypothetical protein
MQPAILNPRGFSLCDRERVRWGRLWAVTRYTYLADAVAPLTCFDGCAYWRPDNRFRCDGASIPPPLHGLPGYGPHDALGYVFHDSAYIHGGLWRAEPNVGVYVFTKLTRAEADRMMYIVDRADGLRWGAAHARYCAVRLCGGRAWARYRADPRLHYAQQAGAL